MESKAFTMQVFSHRDIVFPLSAAGQVRNSLAFLVETKNVLRASSLHVIRRPATFHKEQVESLSESCSDSIAAASARVGG